MEWRIRRARKAGREPEEGKEAQGRDSVTSGGSEEGTGEEEGGGRGISVMRGAGKRRRRGKRGGWREGFMGRGGEVRQDPSLLVWNAQGMMSAKGHKRDELAMLVQEQRPRVVAITESHLDDSFGDGEVRVLPSDLAPKQT